MLPESLNAKLNEYIRKYFILGGMPAAVQEFCETGKRSWNTLNPVCAKRIKKV
ncbi:hypothetical protein D1BOALGB6SA_1865 [Olavius sp. associated proteobacterium Delta 1]|nr:hypothetical protein D1BOALGB6SA_1865 [Olavius sp. associated proteobacterium Delta 1]